jgi:hypothetical protein
MLSDGAPAWLLAWQDEQRQRQPASPPAAPPPTPARVPETFRKEALIGISEPLPWEYDLCVRREPVLDTTFTPTRVVRKVGWHHCLKCRRPFFSEDVVRLRLCSGSVGCREDEDRYLKF